LNLRLSDDVGSVDDSDRHRRRQRTARVREEPPPVHRHAVAITLTGTSPVPHWTTCSARNSTDFGMVRPSALAALRFTVSSNLLGCSTGRSPGLAPFRILSTWPAARRHMYATSTP